MNENAVATKPRVIEAKNGNWYLYFSVRHPFTGKLCPVKIEKGFKKCVSIEEKREHGRTLIKEYTTKLKRGWSPWNKDEIILSKNSDDALVIDFDFLNCIAQLSVTNSQYVPYQFVYFEAMDIEVTDLEDITPIYSFHDDDSMQKDEVIGALDEALLFCTNYKAK